MRAPFRLPSLRATSSSLIATMALAIAVTGCTSDDDDKRRDTSTSPTTSGTATPATTTDLAYAQDPAAAIAMARKASVEDQRPVLLDFGADWCVDCVVLDELYSRPAVAEVLGKHFHLVKVDVGEFNKNLDVADSYIDLNTSGIPALVVITPAGKIEYASNSGEFATARTMDERQLLAFLDRWIDAA